MCEPSLESLYRILNGAAYEFLKAFVVSNSSTSDLTTASGHLYDRVIGLLSMTALEKQSAESCGWMGATLVCLWNSPRNFFIQPNQSPEHDMSHDGGILWPPSRAGGLST